jgi:nicotinamide-nucleotide amidase
MIKFPITLIFFGECHMSKQLSVLIEELARFCLEKSLKVVTAESCTGGGVAYEITSLSGSSNWFERGFVTYSNLSKIEMLGVAKSAIEMHGAVSREVAIQMAEGALKHSHGNVSLAITGIAGPEGGTSQKPVGTCWFAWASRYFPTVCQQQLLGDDREAIRIAAIQFSLEQLYRLIAENI